MDTVGFLSAPIGLAGDIDDCDDGALLLLPGVFGHDVAHGTRELPAFNEADLAVARAWEAVLGIRHDGDVARALIRQRGVDDLQRGAIARHRRAVGECADPGRAARGKFVLAHA